MTTTSCPDWAQNCHDCGQSIPGGTWRQYVDETSLRVRHINGCPPAKVYCWCGTALVRVLLDVGISRTVFHCPAHGYQDRTYDPTPQPPGTPHG